MTPLVHAIRHAQGWHNIDVKNHTIHDPTLTPLGENQCHALAKTFPRHQTINLIVSSPLKRTLDTTLLCFGKILRDRNMKVLVLPELQETSDLPCDTGTDIEELERVYKDQPLDFSLLKPGWQAKKGRYSSSKQAIETRAREVRVWLRGRSEKEIVILLGGFLHFFTTDWSDHDSLSGTGWQNTEYRTYNFPEPENPEAPVQETPESQQRRRAEALKNKNLDEEEKTNLEKTGAMTKQGCERGRELQAGKA